MPRQKRWPMIDRRPGTRNGTRSTALGTSSSVYVFVPSWRRDSWGPGIVHDDRASPASRRIVARSRSSTRGILVLLRNADRKRTRRCVPSVVLIWLADRNHAKIIAQRHPSCSRSSVASVSVKEEGSEARRSGPERDARRRKEGKKRTTGVWYFVLTRCCATYLRARRMQNARTGPRRHELLRMRIDRGSASLRDSWSANKPHAASTQQPRFLCFDRLGD